MKLFIAKVRYSFWNQVLRTAIAIGTWEFLFNKWRDAGYALVDAKLKAKE